MGDIQKVKVLTMQISTENETVPANCNDITFVNVSQVPGQIVYIDTFPLLPGASIMFGGNKDEMIVQGFRVVTPAGTPVGICFVFRKTYIK